MPLEKVWERLGFPAGRLPILLQAGQGDIMTSGTFPEEAAEEAVTHDYLVQHCSMHERQPDCARRGRSLSSRLAASVKDALVAKR
mmetsp:Transcript_2629/g.5606  ORF Transcript_2629/g.5606 Transcript_2629/m.5606 type:complete len:85 (+) Transcript_2629:480-734(+)